MTSGKSLYLLSMVVTSTTSSILGSSFRKKLYGCVEDLVIYISTCKKNLGRLFWRCPNWNVSYHILPHIIIWIHKIELWFFVFLFLFLCWQLDTLCNYFQWVDDKMVQCENTIPSNGTSQVDKEMRRRVVKLERKIASERTRGNIVMCLMFMNLILTFITCIYCIVKLR